MRGGSSKTRRFTGRRARPEIASDIAEDRRLRRQLLAAVAHGAAAQERARRRVGTMAALTRLAADERLRAHLVELVNNLDAARRRLEKRRSHRLRNSLLALAGIGGAAALAGRRPTRDWLTAQIGALHGGRPRTISEAIEVDVPVSTAYNQWTQFEQFPRFMEGVEQVRQLDDARLHWVAHIAGKQAEWDAKILEQHSDRQISWISEDGKQTRGTVSFEPITPSRTLVRLSMSYRAEGVTELVGSAAGLDARRVRGDLERFKQLIESQGVESGAWRGDISGGETASSPSL
jgi:uncharacterized membrane protein